MGIEIEIVEDTVSDSSTADVTPAASPYLTAFRSYQLTLERSEQASEAVNKARRLGATEIEIAPLLIAAARAPRAVERATAALDEIGKARQLIDRTNDRISQAVNDASAAALTALRSVEATDKALSIITRKKAIPAAAAPVAPSPTVKEDVEVSAEMPPAVVVEMNAEGFDSTDLSGEIDPVEMSAIAAVERAMAAVTPTVGEIFTDKADKPKSKK